MALPALTGAFEHKCRLETFDKPNSSASTSSHEHEHQLLGKFQARSVTRVLSVDGGGLRGVMPACLLWDISKHAHNTPIYQLGDQFGGVSTGALLMGSHLLPGDRPDGTRYSPEEIVKSYSVTGPIIFKKNFCHEVATVGGLIGPQFESKNLIESVQKTTGKILFRELLGQFYTQSYDMERKETFIFTRDQALNNPDPHWKNLPAWVPVVASSSAPTYFDPLEYEISNPVLNFEKDNKRKFVDGGVARNNVTLSTCLEAQRIFDSRPENMLVVSIGTGDDVSAPVPHNGTGAGLLQYAAPISSTFLSAGVDSAQNDMRLFMAGTHDRLYRIQFDITYDKSSLSDISLIPYWTEVYKKWADGHQDELRSIAMKLYRPGQAAGETHAVSESDQVV